MTDTRPLALITGASRGLGAALASQLAALGWDLVLTARGADALDAVAADIGRAHGGRVDAIAGDVTDPAHRAALAAAVGHRDLAALVHNASYLGPSPQPGLCDYPAAEFSRVLDVNVVAPVALTAALEGALGVGGAVVHVSSDAGAEAYPGWGGYGASKAALEHAARVLAAERDSWRVYAYDPGDMNTQMHAEAFPGEDLSHLPDPSESAPGIVALLSGARPSGRYTVTEFTGEVS